MTDYLVAKGWAVVDVPYDVDASDEVGWENEWLAYLADAGVNGKAEAGILVNWLRARSTRACAVQVVVRPLGRELSVSASHPEAQA